MGGGLTQIVRNLLLINVAVFLFQNILRIDFPMFFALRYFESNAFAPWQVLTYMFVHADLMHIFSNMISLIVFGPLLENALGGRRFLALYMICGMGAGLFNYGVIYVEMQMQKQAIEVYAANPTEDNFLTYMNTFEPRLAKEKADVLNDYLEQHGTKGSLELVRESYEYKKQGQSVIGASGATFGIMMGAFLLFTNLQVMLLFFPYPVKLGYVVGLFMIFDVYSLITQGQQSSVAHLAHLGGALIAFVLIKYWKIPRQF